jgi:PAS domain S-box-containing protein
MLEPDLRITYWNRGAERLYGWSSEEAVGRDVSDLLKTRFPIPRDAVLDELRRCDLWEGELEHTRRDGDTLMVASRWLLRRDAAGVPRAILDANNDITMRKRGEAEIRRQAEALESANAELRAADRYKDEFLGILSHELRTPLNFIISYASVLEEEVVGPLNEQEHEFVSKVLLGADRLLAMVDNLLEMSRLAAKKFRLSRSWTAYGDLVDGALAVLAPLAAEKRITLRHEVEVPEELWLDGEHIRRVLINLADNAIKFTGPGGQVTVSARLEGDRLVTEVRDTGVGISEADLPKLFTRFKQLDMSATREAGGMGIGLALSKAIVEGHGGTLSVTSQPGKGSCFRFELPLVEPPSLP